MDSINRCREELINFLLYKYSVSSSKLPITVSMYIIDIYVMFLDRTGIKSPVADDRISEIFSNYGSEYCKAIIYILEDFETFFDKLGLVNPIEGRDLQREIDDVDNLLLLKSIHIHL